ncbi:SGNH/GDSL hydrolase family protein [Paenibacillus ehimensis]|uniref:SGNH/GDSL hydrolase family protein n=1 Tax=Paenibacillus ehimensis TaxID=79264 RepID=UPI00047105FB|nr:SGNH/GDSL hydrolase family protein [Paenibacillus ehimensis]
MKITRVQAKKILDQLGKPSSRGNLVSAIGDSITANNGDAVRKQCKGYLNWAALLSDQRFRIAPHFATPGFTTERILRESLSALLDSAFRPDYCVVLGGTNDVGNALPVPSILKNLEEIYTGLLNAGIGPIAATIPPRDGASAFQQTNIVNLNTGIKLLAAKLAIPVVDFHEALTDPATANFYPGYATDQIHPGTLGARAMGKALADVLGSLVPAWKPPLSVAANDPANLIANPLFLVDSNSDGTPDRWTVHAAAGATFSMETPAAGEPVSGKWFKCTRASDSGSTTTYRIATLTGVNPGDRIALGFKFKCSLEAAPSGKVGMMLYKDKAVTTQIIGPLYDWDRDTEAHTVYREFTIPADVTALQLDVNFSGAGTVWLAQMTMRNLTTAGLADL